jgi:hypothetical protein
MADRVALITALVLERPLCASCIAAKSLVTEERVGEVLAAIGRALVVTAENGPCVACGRSTTVHSIRRPPVP